MKLISRRKACLICKNNIANFLAKSLAISWLCGSKNGHSFTSKFSQKQTDVINESGDFVAEIKHLKKLALPKRSYLYQIPTAEQLKKFRELAIALISQNLQTALYIANILNYELVKFIDRSSQQVLYGIREKRLNNSSSRGWGSYFVNPSYRAEALVETPHLLFDRFTAEIGAKVFLNSGARGFLIAGAHRHANNNDRADVCDAIDSVFQEVHQAWVNFQLKTWQIHGFRGASKTKFPSDTAIVLSNGKGQITPEIVDLNQRLEACSFKTYAYNTLAVSDFLNQQVNEEISGKTFLSLAGTQNQQGIYCHRLGVAFTHLELEQRIRYSQKNQSLAADAIADSIQAVAK